MKDGDGDVLGTLARGNEGDEVGGDLRFVVVVGGDLLDSWEGLFDGQGSVLWGFAFFSDFLLLLFLALFVFLGGILDEGGEIYNISSHFNALVTLRNRIWDNNEDNVKYFIQGFTASISYCLESFYYELIIMMSTLIISRDSDANQFISRGENKYIYKNYKTLL